MHLHWQDNCVAHYADGSHGLQYVVFRGFKTTVVQRTPSARRHGKTVIHRQQDAPGLVADRELAQSWEDEEAS